VATERSCGGQREKYEPRPDRGAGVASVGIIAVSRCGGRLAPRWWGIIAVSRCGGRLAPRWWGSLPFQDAAEGWRLAGGGSLPFQDAAETGASLVGIIAVSRCGGRLGASPGGDHCRFKMRRKAGTLAGGDHCRFKMGRKAGASLVGIIAVSRCGVRLGASPVGIIVSRCGGRLGPSPGGDHCRFKMPRSPASRTDCPAQSRTIFRLLVANLERAMIPPAAHSAANLPRSPSPAPAGDDPPFKMHRAAGASGLTAQLRARSNHGGRSSES
jgi:hypothetical protein